MLSQFFFHATVPVTPGSELVLFRHRPERRGHHRGAGRRGVQPRSASTRGPHAHCMAAISVAYDRWRPDLCQPPFIYVTGRWNTISEAAAGTEGFDANVRPMAGNMTFTRATRTGCRVGDHRDGPPSAIPPATWYRLESEGAGSVIFSRIFSPNHPVSGRWRGPMGGALRRRQGPWPQDQRPPPHASSHDRRPTVSRRSVSIAVPCRGLCRHRQRRRRVVRLGCPRAGQLMG